MCYCIDGPIKLQQVRILLFSCRYLCRLNTLNSWVLTFADGLAKDVSMALSGNVSYNTGHLMNLVQEISGKQLGFHIVFEENKSHGQRWRTHWELLAIDNSSRWLWSQTINLSASTQLNPMPSNQELKGNFEVLQWRILASPIGQRILGPELWFPFWWPVYICITQTSFVKG